MAYFCKNVLYKSFLKSHKADILIWNGIRPQYHLYMKSKTYYWTVHHDVKKDVIHRKHAIYRGKRVA